MRHAVKNVMPWMPHAHRVKISFTSVGNATGAGVSPSPLPRDPNGSLASTVVPTGEGPINRPGGLHRFYMAF
jgi:hypothetical protein